MKKTEQCTKLVCSFLICYGAQQEILSAVERLIINSNVVKPITNDVFKQNLWLGNIPDPDIIIRTGGVKRLSNFLLFQAAYAEIRFLDCFWPDLTSTMLHDVVHDCMNAQKNFGI